MCFILTAIKIKENKEVKSAILAVMRTEQDDNPHGTGSLCYSKDKPVAIRREMWTYKSTMSEDMDNFDFINYHFRTGTKGIRDESNVHFWKSGNWAFCHNGGITDMGGEVESDSQAFFKEMVKKGYLQKNNKIKGQKIKEFTNDKNFWGRFLIINTKTKNIYFFGDFNVYLVEESYLVITSATAEFKKTVEVLGFEFQTETEYEPLTFDMDGVNYYDYKLQTFSNIFETFKEIKPVVTKHTSTTHTVSRPREVENTGSAGLRFGENGEVLTSKEVESPRIKYRTNDSYIKEFQARLFKEKEKDKSIISDIAQEMGLGQFNEFGLTPTEENFWEFWIVPQMQASNDYRGIYFRDIDTLAYADEMD